VISVAPDHQWLPTQDRWTNIAQRIGDKRSIADVAITISKGPCSHHLHLAMEPRHRGFELMTSKLTSARPKSRERVKRLPCRNCLSICCARSSTRRRQS
jgi:hypothetical protein